MLSGADGDGAIGIKRIKERGGLTIAQDPEEAEHSRHAARRRSPPAWSTGCCRSREMPARLLDYFQRESQLRAAAGGRPAAGRAPRPDRGRRTRRRCATCSRFLRTRTGRDFTYYKRATILRRIARRMQVNGVEDLPAYLDLPAHAARAKPARCCRTC